MHWDDVRVVLAVLRAGKLDAAAKTLDIDASTLSRRIARLETRIGARLFERTRDGLRPTPLASGIRPLAETMEQGAAALEQALTVRGERVEGLVRVAATDALGRILVTDGLLDLRREHPDLVLELVAENRAADLLRGEADVAVRLSELRHASLRVRRVARMPIGLFAARDYLRSHGPVHGAGSLRGHDVLLPSGELSRLPESRWLAARPGVKVAFRSNSMPALVAAATAGHGIVPLPVGWGDSDPLLERVLLLEHLPPRSIWLVTQSAAADRPSVRVVADKLVSLISRSFPH